MNTVADRLKRPGSLEKNPRLSQWLRFERDGTVSVFTGKVEIGQGILTALAQIAAEELGVAPERIRMMTADTSRSPDEGVTSGSLSIHTTSTAQIISVPSGRKSSSSWRSPLAGASSA